MIWSLPCRLKALVEYVRMALDCFFAAWFVIGNVWIFGRHSSSSGAPNLYRYLLSFAAFAALCFVLCLCFLFNHSPFHGCSTNLYIFLSIFRLCVVYLSFSSIGYAMPFILCATLCCCLPCIISVMGSREHLSHFRGAPPDSINSLPTYKFKMKKTRNGKGREIDCDASEGGIVAAGTEKERVISGEDAVSHFLIHFKFPWFITLWNFLDSNTEMDSHTHTHTHDKKIWGYRHGGGHGKD